MKNLANVRDIMIERHLKARGVKNRAVLQAMREVPREAFIPTGSRRAQELIRIRRTAEDAYEQEDLLGVRFVPLVSGPPLAGVPTSETV